MTTLALMVVTALLTPEKYEELELGPPICSPRVPITP